MTRTVLKISIVKKVQSANMKMIEVNVTNETLGVNVHHLLIEFEIAIENVMYHLKIVAIDVMIFVVTLVMILYSLKMKLKDVKLIDNFARKKILIKLDYAIGKFVNHVNHVNLMIERVKMLINVMKN